MNERGEMVASAAKAAAAKAKADAQVAAAVERDKAILAGLERSTVPLPAGAVRGAEVSRHDKTALVEYTTSAGERIVYETWDGYDEYRSYVHAAPSLVRALRLAAAAYAAEVAARRALARIDGGAK